MKKSWLLFLLCLVLCIGGYVALHITINSGRDKVTLTENTVYGDVSAIEGVTVECHTNYSNNLFWDTTYTPGTQPTTVTTYEFSAVDITRPYETTYPGLRMEGDIAYGCSDYENIGGNTGIAQAYAEVYKDATPGQVYEKNVYLKDYYDYYPISIEMDFPGYYLSCDGDIPADTPKPYDEAWHYQYFADFFKIPILPEDSVTITLERSADGSWASWGSSHTGEESFYLWTENVITSDACYFIFDAHSSEGNVVDTSHIAGGYGIYCLPLQSNEDGSCVQPNSQALSTVYTLDPESYLLDFTLSTDQKRLELLTQRGQTIILTVIDIATMTRLQELELTELKETAYVENTYNYPDFKVLTLSNNRLLAITCDTKGIYTIAFETDICPENIELSPDYTATMDWADGKLIIAGHTRDEYRCARNCGFYLAGYTAEGLQYYGIYDSSLDTGNPSYAYYYYCCPNENETLNIQWNR